MCHCGILSMLADQTANICGDGLVSVAENAHGNADAGDARANICGDAFVSMVMYHRGMRSMLANQIANICGDGVATLAEDTLRVEQKPAGPKALAGNGNTVQCMGGGGAGACPRFTSPRSNLTSQLKFNLHELLNLIEVYCLGF